MPAYHYCSCIIFEWVLKYLYLRGTITITDHALFFELFFQLLFVIKSYYRINRFIACSHKFALGKHVLDKLQGKIPSVIMTFIKFIYLNRLIGHYNIVCLDILLLCIYLYWIRPNGSISSSIFLSLMIFHNMFYLFLLTL